MVRSRRLELPRPFGHSDLNAARLPVPPRPHIERPPEGPAAGRPVPLAKRFHTRNAASAPKAEQPPDPGSSPGEDSQAGGCRRPALEGKLVEEHRHAFDAHQLGAVTGGLIKPRDID